MICIKKYNYTNNKMGNKNKDVKILSSKSERREATLKKKYETMASEITPKSKIVPDCLKAFIVGGIICDIGQLIHNIYINFGFAEEKVMNIVPIIMIFIGALLTGTGIYSKLANFGGAGTVVPITGFSNAVVAPAIEFKKEGFVFGVAAKMFTIAGPVLVYGIGSSVIVGILYYVIQLWT